eukprot:2366931-Alexandrium_andersonii.AAC.1
MRSFGCRSLATASCQLAGVLRAVRPPVTRTRAGESFFAGTPFLAAPAGCAAALAGIRVSIERGVEAGRLFSVLCSPLCP